MRSQRSSQRFFRLFLFLSAFSLALGACGGNNAANSQGTPEPVTIRLAYFPNVTHAVALVGVERNTFKTALAPNTLDIKTFNAGPDLINALLADSIDIGYVGPSPAINGYVTSKGTGLRIIAGSASGGASFIVRPDANITRVSDLNGKTLATPQKGNTQDIALRHYLQENNLKTDEEGGTVHITPTANANILTQFKQGQIDGAWVPEPWASRLVLEANGTVFVDERTLWPDNQFVTTNVVVRKEFLDQHPAVVKKFLQAHIETVQYINEHPNEAKQAVNAQLLQLTQKGLDQKVLDRAFKNLDTTYDPLAKTLFSSAENAYDLHFLKEKPDKDIYYLDPLNSVLIAKGLPTVTAS